MKAASRGDNVLIALEWSCKKLLESFDGGPFKFKQNLVKFDRAKFGIKLLNQ